MNLSNLTPASGAVKKGKRIGRGQGSGRGGTSTRGHKGAGSRSGYSTKIGFEGGQMPIQRRVPKYGFKNINRVEYTPINLEDLQRLSENHGVTVFNFEIFQKFGLVSKTDKVKILGSGEISSAFEVNAHAFSESAKNAIESKGGKAINI
jgi:large subunit ribosomal protein L15